MKRESLSHFTFVSDIVYMDVIAVTKYVLPFMKAHKITPRIHASTVRGFKKLY